MKATLIFLSLFVLPVVGRGQMVEDVNLARDTSIQYLEILGVNTGLFKTKITILVDYGQKIKVFDTDTRVQGLDNKVIIFNSMMDAVNRFYSWGWELMFAYDVSSGGNSGTVYHYVLRRKKA